VLWGPEPCSHKCKFSKAIICTVSIIIIHVKSIYRQQAMLQLRWQKDLHMEEGDEREDMRGKTRESGNIRNGTVRRGK
jgi:hypothetical protein